MFGFRLSTPEVIKSLIDLGAISWVLAIPIIGSIFSIIVFVITLVQGEHEALLAFGQEGFLAGLIHSLKACPNVPPGCNLSKKSRALGIIYQIRCNLFHGDKNELNGSEGERNKRYVKIANEILLEILKRIN